MERPGDLAGIPRDGSMIAQAHLPGEEYSLDVLARADGRAVAVVPRVRLKVDSGVSVAGRTVRDPELEAFGRRVAARIGLTSVANVQCRRDERGRPALLEVNPRLSGAMPLTVAAGVNMPSLLLGEDHVPYHEVAMVRFLDDRTFPVEEMRRLEAAASAVTGSGSGVAARVGVPASVASGSPR